MTASRSSVYVYGVTWADGARIPDATGISGGAVDTIERGELAAIVSAVPPGPVRTKRRELLSHMDVVQSVFAKQTVLPVQFGSVFPDRDVLVDELLGNRYEELVALLHQFDGLAELRIRATYRQEEILAEIVQNDERIARLREQTLTAGAADPRRIQLGEAVARTLAALRARDARAISSALLEPSRDAVVEEPRTEFELLRASYLIERRDLPAFDVQMDELARRERDRIAFSYTGPLPPHSFVSLSAGSR